MTARRIALAFNALLVMINGYMQTTSTDIYILLIITWLGLVLLNELIE